MMLPFYPKVMAVTKELDDIPYNNDQNGGKPLGLGMVLDASIETSKSLINTYDRLAYNNQRRWCSLVIHELSRH